MRIPKFVSNAKIMFIKTNVNGTFNLLYSAYKIWFDEPFKAKVGFENALFYHISTDEVFGSLGEEGYFSESTPYAPNSPYSASKASKFLVASSYSFFALGTNSSRLL